MDHSKINNHNLREGSDFENESIDSLAESRKWSARRRALSVARKPSYHTYLITEDYQVVKKDKQKEMGELMLIANETSVSPLRFGSNP